MLNYNIMSSSSINIFNVLIGVEAGAVINLNRDALRKRSITATVGEEEEEESTTLGEVGVRTVGGSRICRIIIEGREKMGIN